MKKIVLIETVLLLLVTIGLLIAELDQQMPFSAIVWNEGAAERLTLWNDTNERFFLCLPGYADMSDARIRLHPGIQVKIGDISLRDEMRCDAFETGVLYSLEYSVFGMKHTSEITFICSEGIASLFIDTQTGDLDYIHNRKGNEERGQLRLISEEGAMLHTGEVKSLKGRGNFTWTHFEKKPYSLELTYPANLLGMGSASNWILLANADDASNVRNKMGFDFAKQVGLENTPECEWVDLYLNGEYRGLYLLSERIEIGTDRIDLTGENSFIVSLELQKRLIEQNYPYLLTEAKLALRIHEPRHMDAMEMDDLQNCWQSIENALLAEDGIDVQTGKHWNELIDMESWVTKYLMEEVFANYDAGFLSQYFYGNVKQGKVFAGPIWDYDQTVGKSGGWQIPMANAFIMNRSVVMEGYTTPWWDALYQSDSFYQALRETYRTKFVPKLKEMLNGTIADYADRIERAVTNDRIRWNGSLESVSAELHKIEGFLTERMEFLNAMWIEERDFVTVIVDPGFSDYFGHYCVEKGETLPALPDLIGYLQTEERFLGWYDSVTNEPVDIDHPLNEDVVVYGKWESVSQQQTGQILVLIPSLLLCAGVVCLLHVDFRRNNRGRELR